MTAFNQSAFIPEAIDSILAQDQPPLEIILVDDGSSEDIASVVAPYGDKVRYIRRENGGLGAARNTGLWATIGEYIAFCDSDDIHSPYRLSAHTALLDQCPEAAMVFSDLSIYEDGVVTKTSTLRGRFDYDFDAEIAAAFGEGTSAAKLGLPLPLEHAEAMVYHGHVIELIAQYHVAWGGASMYRRSALMAVGGHDEAGPWCDWCLASRLCKTYEFIFLDLPVLLYRQHGAQLTKQPALGAKSYRDVVYKVWKQDPVFAARYPKILADIVARAAHKQSYYENLAGNYPSARRHLIDYIRVRPMDPEGYKALALTLYRQYIKSALKPR